MTRDLEADLAICEAATPGPWAVTGKYIVRDKEDREGYRSVVLHLRTPYGVQDQRFAAEARTGWPYAIQRAMEAEERVDSLERELRMLQDQLHSKS